MEIPKRKIVVMEEMGELEKNNSGCSLWSINQMELMIYKLLTEPA